MFSRIFSAFKSKNVLLSEVKNAAVITINRPDKMNSFTAEMNRQIYQLLKDLETSDKTLVMITGAGDKAFCSGIDLIGILSSTDHFEENQTPSFIMDKIQNYKKPYVALIDGITFGGASFFSMTAKYRIATERTVFAMPEAKISFYNNAGSSYFLSSLKYNLGYYIVLSCARISGYDVKKIGLASHFIESSQMETFKEKLGACVSEEDVSNVVESFSFTPKSTASPLDEVLPLIDKCFDGDSVEEIYANLHLDGSEWALKMIRIMNELSPSSLKICHRLLKLGKDLSLRECLAMENRLTINILKHKNADLIEGVNALLVEKRRPNWNPKTLKEVKDEDIEKLFNRLPEEYELKFNTIPSKL